MTQRIRCRAQVFALCVFAAAGCGELQKAMEKKEESSSGEKKGAVARSSGAMTFNNEEKLPDCNEKRDGFLVYVRSTKSFRVCADGSWTVIDLKGEKGENGADGKDGQDAFDTFSAGLQLYKKYRRSVYRVTLQCQFDTEDSSCTADDQVASGDSATYHGSAFLCGKNTVCTNQHVVACRPCYNRTNLSMQSVDSNRDSVAPSDTPIEPFFDKTDPSVSLHSARDLAKVKVSDAPEDATPLPMSDTQFQESVSALLPILSMSFPLGFQDLYTDVGSVNNDYIGECRDNTDYTCPSQYWDFATSNDTDKGSSGSPLLDIKSGKVIGVTSAGTKDENANYTWAIDASALGDIENP